MFRKSLHIAFFLLASANCFANESSDHKLSALPAIEVRFFLQDLQKFNLNAEDVARSLLFNAMAQNSIWKKSTKNGTSGIDRHAGVFVRPEKSVGAVLSYVHFDRYSSTRGEYGQVLEFRIQLLTETIGKQITVKFIPPEKAQLTSKSFALLPFPKLPDPEQLVSEFAKNFPTLITTKVLAIKAFEAAVDSEFPVDAILANFERHHARVSSSSSNRIGNETERSGSFNLKVGDFNQLTMIKIFPYRTGSKVIAKGNLRCQFESAKESSCEPSEEQIIQILKSTAND